MTEDSRDEGVDSAIVATLHTSIEAQLVKSAFASAGIESWLSTEYLSTVSPPLGAAVGIDVVVRRADLEAAAELLRGLESGAAALPAEVEPCPKCGSDSTLHVRRLDRGTAMVAFLLGGGPTRPGDWAWHCERCRHSWREDAT